MAAVAEFRPRSRQRGLTLGEGSGPVASVEVIGMTDYIEDFEDGTDGATFVDFTQLPTGTMLVAGTSVTYSNDVVHSGSLALAMNNGSVDWSLSNEGPWHTILFEAWFRMAHTEETDTWAGTNQLQLVSAVDLDNFAVASVVLFNPDEATVTVDTTIDAVDAGSASDTFTFGMDTWYLARISTDGTSIIAELADDSLTILASVSQPWTLPGLFCSFVYGAGAGGAAEFAYSDDIELTLVAPAGGNYALGETRQSFLRG